MNKVKELIKNFILTHEEIGYFIVKINNLLGKNSKIRGGKVHKSVSLKGTKCTYRGSNNIIEIAENCKLCNCTFVFYGNDNHIKIDRNCNLNNVTFWCEDDGNYVEIGAETTIQGSTHISSIEGKRIIIGNDCMFSSDIYLRNGDSHSVLDEKGQRTNQSKDIIIGNHSWIGQKVFIGKGVCIPDQSIVGACAVVTKSFTETNVVIAGNPASIVKRNINWDRKRIKI